MEHEGDACRIGDRVRRQAVDGHGGSNVQNGKSGGTFVVDEDFFALKRRNEANREQDGCVGEGSEGH